MPELKTSESLLRALREATRAQSAEERHQQRVSFVMGSLGSESTMTRAEVESIIGTQEG